MTRIFLLFVWVWCVLLPAASANEALARRYQDVSACRIWASDRTLSCVILSSDLPNELLMCEGTERRKISFPELKQITRVLVLRDGSLLAAGENTQGRTQIFLREKGGQQRDVTPRHLPAWCVPIMEAERGGHRYILAQGAPAPRANADLYLLDIQEHSCDLFFRNESNISSWAWKEDGTPLAALRWEKDGSKHLCAIATDGTLRQVLRVPMTTRLNLVGRADDESVYVLHDMDGEGTRLARVRLRDARIEGVYEDKRWDVCSLFLDWDGKLLGVNVLRAYNEYEPLVKDAAVDEFRAALPEGATFVPVNLSAGRQRLLAELYMPGEPVRVVLWERGKGIRNLSPVQDIPRTYRTHFAEYPAKDGTPIPVYYTLPEGKGPFPTVVFVHGGPRARTDANYDWRVQYLVSQGFAVVQPQFRGSRGWGRTFMHAGNRQWGKGVMQTDVNDCLPWLEQQGIAEPGKVAIFGGSYGGYAVTAALCFYPGMYACGVSLFGPQNILLYLQQINAVDSSYMGEDSLTVGDIYAFGEVKRLMDISPVFRAYNFRDPLLIYYGEKDTLIPPEHSRQLIAAMKREGRDVTALSLPDEGHGFVDPIHEPWLYACHIVPFLRNHLLKK